MSLRRNVFVVVVVVMVLVLVMTGMANAQKNKAIHDKNIERIVGTWKIQKILSGKTEVAKNPTSGQWIEFRTNGKYVNKTNSVDSGSYRLNENQSVLYLESVVNKEPGKDEAKNIVEWTVAFQDNDSMTMQQQKKDKKPHGDVMKYVYTRIADGSRALNN